MPIEYHARGRVGERNRLGPAYYAALYEDEPLEPGVLTDPTMPGRGILSYLDQFDDAAGEDPTPRNPIFASSLDTDALPFMDRRRIRFSEADPGSAPDIGEPLGPSALTDAMTRRSGIWSYPDRFSDLIYRGDGPPNFIFLPNLDADTAAFTDLKRPTFSNTDPEPVPASLVSPDTREALGSGALTEASRFSPRILFDQNTEEAAFGEKSGAGVSNAKSDAGLIPGTIPDTGERLSPGILATPSQSRDAPYQGSKGNAGAQEIKLPKALFTWPEIGKIGHAEGLESIIPFWGAGRNTLADLQEGNYAGAALNAALLASDFFLWGAPAKLIYKAGMAGFKKGGLKGALDGSKYAIKGPGSPNVKDRWEHAKYWMKEYDMLHSPNEGHHWLIPQGGWGKNWPDAIKHHPFNIIELPKPVHRRLHTRWLGQPRYSRAQRYWHGKPRWFKALNAEMLGHSIEGYRSYQRTHSPSGPGAGPSMGTTKYRPARYD